MPATALCKGVSALDPAVGVMPQWPRGGIGTGMASGFAEQAKDWDWLPRAATEIERYLERLLQEEPIKPHAVIGRCKSISSFLTKQSRKSYEDPKKDMTDCVAARVILYTNRDRDRVSELIRERFTCIEDHNPGEGREVGLQGYDTQHLVVSGEVGVAAAEEAAVDGGRGSGWIAAGGDLARYFEQYGGLEIQVRTVASHAWSQFEHSRRYKGAEYKLLEKDAQERINALFRDADTNRRGLDDVFSKIVDALTEASVQVEPDHEPEEEAPHNPDVTDDVKTPVDTLTLGEFLKTRFPAAEVATEAGLNFGCQLLAATGASTIEELREMLRSVPSDLVVSLLGGDTPVTGVRRLDDELLVARGERYIEETQNIGHRPWVDSRPKQLRWRHGIIRNKFSVYELSGDACPEAYRGRSFPAARMVRAIVETLGKELGAEAVLYPDVVAREEADLLASSRGREMELGEETVWVRTNLSREWAVAVIEGLLGRRGDLELFVSGPGISPDVAPLAR